MHPPISQDNISPNNKKAKKNQMAKAAAHTSFDVNDRAALDRRAQRFAREHQIEAQKATPTYNTGGQASLFRNNPRNSHLYDHLRSGSPFLSPDGPEGDPVSHLCKITVRMYTQWSMPLQNVPNWDKHTIVGTSQEIFKDYLRLTSVSAALLIAPRVPLNLDVPHRILNLN